MSEQLINIDPIIYVMPERFYSAPKKGLSSATLFFVAVGALFVLVVGGAAWYFTQDLRQPALPASPVIELPAVLPKQEETPVVAPPTPEVPVSANPSETPTPLPETKPEEAPAPMPVLARGQDTDSDGLTDQEEILFNTNPSLPDTDGDGYLDGHETFYLYNPSGLAPERLEDAGLAKRFSNQNFSYEILYPAKWTSASQGADNKEVDFQSATGEFITVTAKENLENLSLNDWLKKQGEDLTSWQEITSRAGVQGWIKNDKTKAYFINAQGAVIEISYQLAGKEVLEYTRVFEMMVNSFVLK